MKKTIGFLSVRAAVALLTTLLLTLTAQTAQAQAVDWDETTKTLTFSGSSGIEYTTVEASEHREDVEHVILDDEIICIDWSAFEGCKKLKTVKIGSNVKDIGGCAFLSCSSLNSIIIGTGVKKIGKEAFADIPQNAKVYVLPSIPPTLGNDAFGTGTNSPTFYLHGDEYTVDGWNELTNVSIISDVCFSTGITASGTPVLSYNGRDYYTVESTFTLDDGPNYFIFNDKYGSDMTDIVLNNLVVTVPSCDIIVGEVATGNCGVSGNNVTWEYNSATYVLTISGTGAMADYNDDAEQPWSAYQKEMCEIVVENGVTSIGTHAFGSCDAVRSVTIPAGITSIGNSAFSECSGLQSITIPASVTSIGDHAFYYSTGLESVSVVAPSCSLGTEAFENCYSLKDIFVFRDKVNDYQNAADWRPYLSIIKCFPYWTSGDCTVSLAGGTTLIVEKTDPSSTTGDMADYNDFDDREWDGKRSDITNIIIEDGVTHIGDNAFAYCNNISLTTIPTSVTSIGKLAFLNCSDLTSIDIPASVTSIGEYSFDGCTGLTSITFHKGLKTIGEKAFFNCSNIGLTSIIIPSSIEDIGERAFENCMNLISVTILANSLKTYGEKAFIGVADGLQIYVPASSVDTYKSNWGEYVTFIKGLYVSPGDVNGNGEVDIDDAVSILRHLVSKPNATFIEETADVNGNGGIDIDDAVSILKYLVGKITTLPTNDGGQKGVGRRGGYDPTNDNPFN